jgi:hypothetical protein
MRGAIPPLLQYAFMAWCSLEKSTETTLPLLCPERPSTFPSGDGGRGLTTLSSTEIKMREALSLGHLHGAAVVSTKVLHGGTVTGLTIT